MIVVVGWVGWGGVGCNILVFEYHFVPMYEKNVEMLHHFWDKFYKARKK